jgi:hypothetical protein
MKVLAFQVMKVLMIAGLVAASGCGTTATRVVRVTPDSDGVSPGVDRPTVTVFDDYTVDDVEVWVVSLIATSQNFNVVTFDGAGLLDGLNIPASGVLEPGNGSNVFRPQDSVVGGKGAMFIASDTNSSIAIYNNFLSASGTRRPDREISGPESMIERPISLAIDQENDVLYVANREDENILVFEGASYEGMNGDVAPSRTFTREFGRMSPTQIYFANGSLYVVDDEEILVFEDDGTLNGSVPISRLITNTNWRSSTRLNVAVDSIDRMIITTRSDEVLIYNDASTLDGSPMPDQTLLIKGASALNAAVIDAYDTLYAMDYTDRAIYAVDLVSTLVDGVVLPDRAIQGPGFEGSDRMFLYERYETVIP